MERHMSRLSPLCHLGRNNFVSKAEHNHHLIAFDRRSFLVRYWLWGISGDVFGVHPTHRCFGEGARKEACEGESPFGVVAVFIVSCETFRASK